ERRRMAAGADSGLAGIFTHVYNLPAMSVTGGDKSKEVLFKERQTFQQTWLRVFLIVLPAFLIAWSLYILYEQFILNVPVGNNPMSDLGVIITVIFTLAIGIGLPILVFRTYLLVTVDPEALHISFSPFTHRTIPVQSIIYCEPRTVRLFRDFGGLAC